MQINKIIKEIATIADSNNFDQVLHNVLIENNSIVASNGAILACFKNKLEAPDLPKIKGVKYTLSKKLILRAKEILKINLVKKAPLSQLLNVFAGNETADSVELITTDDLTSVNKITVWKEKNYHDWKKIIPEKIIEERLFDLDSLIKLLTVFKKAGHKTIKLEICEEKKPMVIKADEDMGLIMPKVKS